MDDDNPKIITAEDYENRKLSSIDEQFLKATEGGEELIQIKSVEELMELAKKAKVAYDSILKNVQQIMTKARAEQVYGYYVTQKYSWRLLAVACWSQWNDAHWQPATNQLAGMALCEVAQKILKRKF